MGLSIFLEVKDGVVLAEGVACPPGALGEDGSHFFCDAVFLCDVEVAY